MKQKVPFLLPWKRHESRDLQSALYPWRHAGGGVRVHMTNNVEECMKKHDGGGGGRVKNTPK